MEKQLFTIMAKLTIYIVLLVLICSSGGKATIYDILLDGPVWLGESLTLVIEMPTIRRPILWKSLNYKYECDRICADGADYKVTHAGNRSTLWIREVTRNFSTWQVQDYNNDGGKIDLDINVKPKIEITNTNCKYELKARDSRPTTSIECFGGNETLNVTKISLIDSSDGKTVTTTGILYIFNFSGIVTCNFTVGKLFVDNRQFQAACSSSGKPHVVVPDGPVWLGNSTALTINIPLLKRPIVWKTLNYIYECDNSCTNGSNYNVTQTGDTSTLWIREVSWKFSTWQVQDDNAEGGKIDLDINVKPNIEMANTNCSYELKAQDSRPMTSIECFGGNKPFNFNKVTQSSSADGRTFNNTAILNISDFSGKVTCNFIMGEVFRENRHFQVECDVPKPRNCTLIIIFMVLFQILLVLGMFVFWCIRNMKYENCGKDEKTLSIKWLVFIAVGLFLAVLIEIFAITFLVLCLEGRQMISQTGDIALLLVFDVVFLAWIIAGYFLFKKLRKQIKPHEGGKENDTDTGECETIPESTKGYSMDTGQYETIPESTKGCGKNTEEREDPSPYSQTELTTL